MSAERGRRRGGQPGRRHRQAPRRPVDPARRAAYDALRSVHAGGAYANLALGDILDRRRLDDRDAALRRRRLRHSVVDRDLLQPGPHLVQHALALVLARVYLAGSSQCKMTGKRYHTDSENA